MGWRGKKEHHWKSHFNNRLPAVQIIIVFVTGLQWYATVSGSDEVHSIITLVSPSVFWNWESHRYVTLIPSSLIDFTVYSISGGSSQLSTKNDLKSQNYSAFNLHKTLFSTLYKSCIIHVAITPVWLAETPTNSILNQLSQKILLTIIDWTCELWCVNHTGMRYNQVWSNSPALELLPLDW